MYKSLTLVLHMLQHLVYISYNRDHYSLGRLTQHKIKENLVAFFQNLSASEKNKPSADIFNQISYHETFSSLLREMRWETFFTYTVPKILFDFPLV